MTGGVAFGIGQDDGFLSEEEARTVEEFLSGRELDGRRVLVVVPDGTRTAPIPLMARLIHKQLSGRVAELNFLIALGTHRPMSRQRMDRHFGLSGAMWEESFPGAGVHNHEWWEEQTFVSLGAISAGEIAEISGGMLSEAVEIRVNRLVVEHDAVILCGPVFPHEVVGFSGGNKYFFPGVGGPEIIDLSHWLGALITNREIIGRRGITPVRRLIDRAASLITIPKLCFAMVVVGEGAGLAGLCAGSPEEAWAAAADLSARVHVRYVKKPFRRVLSRMPEAYEDIWTAAKGMYKLEPAVADGGEIVVYAPHITEFSYAHGGELAEVGYHVRDYFTKQWARFKGYPGAVLAHSTHLKGAGAYDAETGRERPRVRVTLATSISEERCRAHNVGYLDPDSVDLEEWRGREDEGVLMVPRAGEVLYRLRAAGA
ncbi:MAG: lactate racemase domain-containing protein [Rubrobacteraceae bacterium]